MSGHVNGVHMHGSGAAAYPGPSCRHAPTSGFLGGTAPVSVINQET